MLGTAALVNTSNAQISEPYGKISLSLVGEGNRALEAGNYNTALARFEQAMVADPQNIEAYVGLGSLYFEVKSYSLSLKYFDIALSLNPTSMPILELAAYSHLATDSLDEVEEIRKKMETICLGDSCEELERLNQALETNQASVETDNSNS
jgi:tetratricopeptide (TPR) repeat protein